MKSALWPSLPIRRLGAVVGGGTPTPADENWGGGIPFVTPPDLRGVIGKVIHSTERTLTPAGVESGSSIVPAGSVLLSTRAPIGYVARTEYEVAFNQGCRAIVPTSDMDPQYVVYALMASSTELEAHGRGTTFTELSGGQMAALELPVPPLGTQRAIADYLDREIAQIDTLIARQEQLIATLRERRHASVDAMARDIRGARVKLKRLFTPSSATSNGNEEVLSVFREYGVVPKASREGNFNRTPEDVSRYLRVEVGDLVVNKMKAWQGSLGVSPHEGIVSGDYEVARPITDRLLPRYAHQFLRSPMMVSEYASRSTGIRPSQWRLYWEQLGEIEIPVPMMATQAHAVEALDESLARIDVLSEKAGRFIELAKERRSALITAAVTGQIDVRAA